LNGADEPIALCQTGGTELGVQNLPETQPFADARRHRRFELQTDIRVYSRTTGLLKGYTVDIGESGISAQLKLEVSVGEVVELEFELPSGPVAIRAVVRYKTAFRYGFQFVEPDPQGVIMATCSRLAALQS
jgi:hypothetical protein